VKKEVSPPNENSATCVMVEWSNPGLCDVRQKQRADDVESGADSQCHTSGTRHVRQRERPKSAASELAVATVQREADVDADHADDERRDRQTSQTVHQTSGRHRLPDRLQVQRQSDCSVEREAEADGRYESTD